MGVTILSLHEQNIILSLSEKGFLTLKEIETAFPDGNIDLDEVKALLKERNIDFFFEDDSEDGCDIENITDTVLLESMKLNSGIAQYIHEICSYKILNFEEEQSLRVLIHQGQIAEKELKDTSELTKEEIDNLQDIAEKGKSAKDKIILTHLRLVLYYAKKFQGHGVSLEDLIQEGISAMLYAINKFDMTRSIKFSTYATFWIRQGCQKAVSELGNSKRVPPSSQYQLKRFLKTKSIMAQELGHEPDDIEVCKRLGLSYKKFKTIQDAYNSQAISMDQGVNVKKQDAEKVTIGDTIPDTRKSALQEMIDQQRSDVLYQTMSKILNDREIFIIYHRYGLKDCKRMTLEEIGQELGITRERVRQIEDKILEKFRRNSEFCKMIL